MKNLLVLTLSAVALAAALPPLRAQSVEFTAASRVEGMYNAEEKDFGWGASSFYTYLDGEIGEHWSYSICNHWLNSNPKYLYQDFKYAEEVDFLDWASITYSTGNWEFTLGKDGLTLDSYEIMPDDIDSYEATLGVMWNSLSAYQWGGMASYAFDDANSLELRVCSSPFTVHYFDEVMTSLFWRGNPTGSWTTVWGASYDTGDRQFITLSNRFGGDRLFGTLESYTGFNGFEAQTNEEAVSLTWAPSEKFSLTGRCGAWGFKGQGYDVFYGGAVAEYKPLAGSDSFFSDLRFHVSAAYNDIFGGFVGVFGITCPLTWSK